MNTTYQYWLLLVAIVHNACLHSYMINPKSNCRSGLSVRTNVLFRRSCHVDPSISFGGVKFLPPLSTGLRNLGIKIPSPIQNVSIAAITAGLTCVLHAETGSGKTLAYLLPMLKRVNFLDAANVHPLQACIIVPTKELAVQVAADISALLPGQNSPHDPVHLCITTIRSGLDQISSPIVVGTPVKLLDALRSSTSRTVNSFNYVVLDEVDRLLGSPSKYETAAEKREASLNMNPTEELLSLLVSSRSNKKQLNSMQFVAASATVGRPLRRQLANILQGGASFGDFPVLRPEGEAVGSKGSQAVNTRKIGIPSSIRHIAVLVNDNDAPGDGDDDGTITRKVVVVKNTWTTLRKASRCLLFVPKSEQVKQIVGMLKFWGVHEVQDLQSTLGLNNSRPLSSTTHSSLRDKSVAPKMTSGEMIQQALQHGIGAGAQLQQQAYATATEPPLVACAQDRSSKVSLVQRIKQKRSAIEISNRQQDSPFTSADLVSTGQLRLQERQLLVVPVSGTRGLHIQDVDYVFITKPPRAMDEYLHMAGRTGRRGNRKATGTVITYVSLDELKRLISWQTPLGIEFEIKYEHQLQGLLE